MRIVQIERDDIENVNVFLKGMNAAYQERSMSQIPFRELGITSLLDGIEKDGYIFLCKREEQVLGGFCCDYCSNGKEKIAKIYYVWTQPEFRRQGVGKQMLRHAELEAVKRDCNWMQLNVASNYIPAIRLYEKEGYFPILVYANEPGTYHFIRFIKDIPPYKYSKIKRFVTLFWSKVKFVILFREDSSPTWVNKVVYAKFKAR